MAINRFFKPVEYSYTPIPFQELMTVGRELNRQREQAEAELNANIRTFGKFVSPSAIDMENYNKESIGKLSPFLEQAAANPEVMKDAAWRASLQAQLNSIDYAKLGMLEQSADNLREGLKMRAKMEAEGLYNPNWDRSDIPNYDTLGSKEVFSDITPVKYMTANELSNKYFDNLKPGDLKPVWIDGIKYRQIGNSVQDLEAIYDTYENDLINSPQGREYMRQFIIDKNGDVSAARDAFREMIIASQMDRTRRPTLQVDQGWLAQQKLAAARGAGTGYSAEQLRPTRQTQLGNDVAIGIMDKVSKLDKSVGDGVNMLITAAQGFNDEYINAKTRYDQTGSDEDFIYMQQMASKVQQAMAEAQMLPLRTIMNNAFKNTAGFDLVNDPSTDKMYNRERYIKGAKSAIDAISSTAALSPIAKGGDPLLTRAGGTPSKYTLSDGSETNVYVFEDSNGFMLTESLLQLATGTQPANPVRNKGISRTGGFALRELLEAGDLHGIHFIPSSNNNITQIAGADNDSHKIVNGKIRIPADQVRNALGSGMAGSWAIPFMKTSATTMIEDQFGGRVVKYGEDGTEYFEIDGSYVLPEDSNDNYWYDIDLLRENSPSHGGVGGATQAKEHIPSTLYDIMTQ